MAHTFVRLFVPLEALAGVPAGESIKLGTVPAEARILGAGMQLFPPGYLLEYEYEDTSLPLTTVTVGIAEDDNGRA
jgi:hypothetical protein